MNQNKLALALSIIQTAELIAKIGHKESIIVQGHMGIGKSALLALICEMTGLEGIMFDAPAKDTGDLFIPMPDVEAGCVRNLPNEDLGFHIDKPLVICIDEIGKCKNALKLPINGLLHSGELCGKKKHPRTIIFGTTNHGAEGLNDLLLPHTRNRTMPVYMRSPTADEQIEYGINQGYDPMGLGWLRDNPHALHTFDMYENPHENEMINDPRAPEREGCLTPRSFERVCMSILPNRDAFDDQTLQMALIAAIGDVAGASLYTFLKLGAQLPTQQSIIDDPMTAKVPDNASARVLVVYRTLTSIDKTWVNQWLTYMERLPKDLQSMFVNGARVDTYAKRDIVFKNKKFTDWCIANSWITAGEV